MNKILIWSFFILQISTTYSQNNYLIISGIVVEKNEKDSTNAIPGVIIKAINNNELATTNIDGQFVLYLRQLPDTLQFTSLGFDTQYVYVNQELNQLVVQIQSGSTLNEVVVVGKNNGHYMDLMRTINVEQIGSSDLRKAACCNLSESFETNASVDVNLTDAVSGAKKIQMLGLDGIYTQIQWENIPLVRGLSTSYGLNFTPGTWINSIQITKGTGSVVNGYESIAGLINLSLKNPDNKETFYLNSYANTFGRAEINLHASQYLKNNWSTTTFLHFSNQLLQIDRNNDGFRDLPIGNNAAFFNRWHKSASSYNIQFGLKLIHSDQLGGQLNAIKNDINLYAVGLNMNHVELFSKSGFFLKNRPQGSIGIINQLKYHDMDNSFGLKDYHGTQRKWYLNAIYSDILKNTNHNIKTGVSFVLDDYHQIYNDSVFNKTEIVPGAFLEYTYKYLNKFSAVAGVRGDIHNLYGSFINPRLHVKWNISPKNALRLSVGTGNRVPNPYADYTSLMASSRTWIVSNDIQAEKALNAGLSFTQKFMFNDLVSTWSLDYYYTSFQNQFIVDMDVSTQTLYLYNSTGTSYSHSFQTELDLKPHQLFEVRLAFKYYDVKAEYGGILQQKAFVPKYRSLINLAYHSRNKKWNYDITANWISQKRLPNTSSNPIEYQRNEISNNFWMLSSQLTYKFKKLDVYIGGENLLNVIQNNAIISVDDPFGLYFDATQLWAPITGANVYIGLHYTLNFKK